MHEEINKTKKPHIPARNGFVVLKSQMHGWMALASSNLMLLPIEGHCMPKQEVVRYDVRLCGGAAFVVASGAEGERASPWREDPLVVTADRLHVDSAPVLHSVAEILEAHVRVRCEVLSESRSTTDAKLLMAVVAVVYGGMG
jgi:hypothetical protein